MEFRGFLCLLCLPALAMGEEKKPSLTWREEAKPYLTTGQIDVLSRQRFLVGDQTFKQVFTPYVYGGRLPVFITTDSILNAFHVLLEESIHRMERANAARLPAFLEYTSGRLDESAQGLPADPALLAAALKRARIVLGTALRLHKDGAGHFDGATDRLIDAEVARITAAKEQMKPDWLGPPDRGFLKIDYSRFAPRGFYTRSGDLQHHFRVVSWLQAIPFRIEKDEELLAALILSRAAVVPKGEKYDAARRGKMVLNGVGAFLGPGDDWGLTMLNPYHSISKEAPWKKDQGKTMIGWLREQLMQQATGGESPQINDQLAFLPDDPGAVPEVSIRVAAAHRLPDAVLFQRTTNPRQLKREFPSGMDLAAALGSPFARKQIGKTEAKSLNLIDLNSKALFYPSLDDADRWRWRGSGLTPSLYAQYLGCLATLIRVTEPDAPAFMRTEAWQAKTCQTALSGWAQMRHTWVLQAKIHIEWLSAVRKPSGFVEPVPEFYRELGLLTERVSDVLSLAGVFADDARIDPDAAFLGQLSAGELYRLEESIAALETAEVRKRGMEAYRRLAEDVRDQARKFAGTVKQGDPDKYDRPAQFITLLAELNRRRDKLLRELEVDVVLGPRWRTLREFCSYLERVAHKQLRGRGFSKDETEFLERYGERLGGLMFYDGNSYQSPRDDAPRVVDVFGSGGKFLEVGIDRPRAMYVLYPWQEKEILCRGAILPYHEFVHGERLTDQAWRNLLKTPARPEAPAWTKILTAGDRP
jgi:hypothetical protein